MSTSRSGSYLLSAACFIAACSAVALTLTITYNFGHSTANSDVGKVVFGLMAGYADVSGFLLMMVAGAFFRWRSWGWGSLVALVGVCFLAFSCTSVVGYGARERMANARAALDDQKARAEAAEKINAAILAQHERQLSWMRDTSVREKDSVEKRRLTREASALALTAPKLIPVPKIDEVQADPQASVFSALTGVRTEIMQMGWTVWVALLLVVGKGVFGALSTALIPRKIEVIETLPAARAPIMLTPEPPGGGELEANNDDEDMISALESDPAVKSVAHVERFLAEATRPAGNGVARISATQMYNAYRNWAEAHGIEVMTQRSFGVACSTLGVDKRRSGSGIEYVGVALEAVRTPEAVRSRAA